MTHEINKSCPICLETINDITFLPCCHFFHKMCIDSWLDKNTTCPECRIPIFIQNSEQLASYNKLQSYLTLTQSEILQLRFINDPSLFSIDALEEINVIKFINMIKKNLVILEYRVEYRVEYEVDCDWICDLANRLDMSNGEQLLAPLCILFILSIILMFGIL